MNKGEITAMVAEKAGLTKGQAAAALDAFIDSIKECLQKGEKVSLIGFGTFQVVEREARMGRNPKTGEQIQIPAKKQVKFKPGKDLSESVNS